MSCCKADFAWSYLKTLSAKTKVTYWRVGFLEQIVNYTIWCSNYIENGEIFASVKSDLTRGNAVENIKIHSKRWLHAYRAGPATIPYDNFGSGILIFVLYSIHAQPQPARTFPACFRPPLSESAKISPRSRSLVNLHLGTAPARPPSSHSPTLSYTCTPRTVKLQDLAYTNSSNQAENCQCKIYTRKITKQIHNFHVAYQRQICIYLLFVFLCKWLN